MAKSRNILLFIQLVYVLVMFALDNWYEGFQWDQVNGLLILHLILPSIALTIRRRTKPNLILNGCNFLAGLILYQGILLILIQLAAVVLSYSMIEKEKRDAFRDVIGK